jgi:hypothetical protein
MRLAHKHMLLWFLVLVAGSLSSLLVAAKWLYIVGFIFGSLATAAMFWGYIEYDKETF